MPYHTEILFFEIFKLYYTITDESAINLKLLEETFYEFQDIINNKEDISIISLKMNLINY